jgi:diadenosine tetraphosphate (Ap4A) HIT family hydrolase
LNGHFVVINNSPIARGHVLIIPRLNSGLNQVMTAEAVRLAVEASHLSGSSNFVVGFNGLGLYATVNHLHMQGYYLDEPFFPARDPLPIHRANKAHSLAKRLWFMDDVDCYFINSFALQLCDFDGNIDEFAE